jgi:hypothetical protein
MQHLSLSLGKTISYPPRQGLLPQVPLTTFIQVDIRIGTVRHAGVNPKARIPSLLLKMDFGEGFSELKQSSAQLCDNYCTSGNSGDVSTVRDQTQVSLLGMQILRVANVEGREAADNIFGVVLKDGKRIPLVLERAMPEGRFLL